MKEYREQCTAFDKFVSKWKNVQIVKSTGRHEVMRGAKWICSHDSWGLGGTESWRHDSGDAERGVSGDGEKGDTV